MESFTTLNGHKLKFAFLTTSLIFIAILTILLTIAHFNGAALDFEFILVTLAIAGLGLPIIVIFFAYLEWYYKTRIRKRAFGTPPFDKLEKIGFKKSTYKEDTKWYFTEEIKGGDINGFHLSCDARTPKIIEFKAFTYRQLDKKELKRLREKFKPHNIEFDFWGLTKKYNIKKNKFETIEQLKTDLEKFTELLRTENFEPEKGWA